MRSRDYSKKEKYWKEHTEKEICSKSEQNERREKNRQSVLPWGKQRNGTAADSGGCDPKTCGWTL